MSKKYFLGSVGRAEAFRKQTDGSLKLAFVSKTLTTSGLTISTTKDDIRAGEGAPIQFSFYHDASVEINLTDVVFKTDYIEAQLGAEFTSTGAVSYKTVKKEFTGEGTATLDEEVKALPFPCSEGSYYAAWAAPIGTDDWQMVTVGSDCKTLTLTGASGYYCIRYLGEDTSARIATITSTIIPQELFLVITAPIFAGDSCAASKGKAAGYIQFEVPRFSLNGSQEFSMEMSSNQTMSLAGVALASESSDCANGGAGQLLRIIEVITDRQYFEDVTSLVVDEDYIRAGLEPHIYGLTQSGTLVAMDKRDLIYRTSSSGTFQRMTSSFVWPTSSTSVTYYVNIATSRDSTTITKFLATDEDVTVAGT